jgi:hypothetical protein
MIKRMLCLANSRKLSGRCIAGIELTGTNVVAGWLRPVSDRLHEEVSEYERQYEDGSDPRLLDIIDVPLLEPRPNDYQQENWLLDPGYYWQKAGTADVGSLGGLVAPPAPLWINGEHSYHGMNDRIPLELAAGLDSSLALIRVEALQLHVFAPGEAFGNAKRRVHGAFVHAGVHYRLWVTDPRYEREYLAQPNGVYPLGPCFLTISLGEPLDGLVYKLIAGVIPDA